MDPMIDHAEVDYADPIDPTEGDYTEKSTPGLPAWARTGREVTVVTQQRWTTVQVSQQQVTHADAARITLDNGLTVQGHGSCREDQTILVKAASNWGEEDVWIVSPEWDGTFQYRSVEVDWDGIFTDMPAAADRAAA